MAADSYSISITSSQEIMFHDPLQTAGDESALLSQACTPLPLPTLSCLRRAPASHRYQVKAAVKLQGGQVTRAVPRRAPRGRCRRLFFTGSWWPLAKTGGTESRHLCISKPPREVMGQTEVFQNQAGQQSGHWTRGLLST